MKCGRSRMEQCSGAAAIPISGNTTASGWTGRWRRLSSSRWPTVSWSTALTAQAIRVASEAAPQVWICAERDNRPRRLYQRLGFRPVIETGTAILPPKRSIP